MKVNTEGEARQALYAFLKHSAKNFKKVIELDDDQLTAAFLTDFLSRVKPHYDVSLIIGGYKLPENEVKDNDE